jgi:hypothetical protein
MHTYNLYSLDFENAENIGFEAALSDTDKYHSLNCFQKDPRLPFNPL